MGMHIRTKGHPGQRSHGSATSAIHASVDEKGKDERKDTFPGDDLRSGLIERCSGRGLRCRRGWRYSSRRRGGTLNGRAALVLHGPGDLRGALLDLTLHLVAGIPHLAHGTSQGACDVRYALASEEEQDEEEDHHEFPPTDIEQERDVQHGPKVSGPVVLLGQRDRCS
jgi:hypothetical protein